MRGIFTNSLASMPIPTSLIRFRLLPLFIFLSLFFSQPPTTSALPNDPNLVLDSTYGLTPRPAGHVYFPSPQDWRDVNIYQIFTDRFADGDAANNTTSAMGINRSSWFVTNSGRSYPFNRNFHHGGDWKGLKDNLDYLTGMGVNSVWISGVQMNAQGRDTRFTPYHQYHPTDFFNVDPSQGTFQELKDLIDACHARGIYVILDVVINHTADLNGLFGNNSNDDNGYWANGNNTFGWWGTRRHAYPFNELIHFHNNGTINNWDTWPEYLYGQFKGTDDLKTDSSHVTYWITEAFKNLIDATDCDGFRVDAIKHVEFNWVVKWADDIRQHAASRGKSDFILFGEYFTYDNNTLASHVKDPGSFNSALFFPMSQTIKSVFIDGAGSGQLTGQLNNASLYGEGATRLVTFIDNHDVNRISQQNGGDTGNDVWKLRPALSFLYLATPVPCLYYGTEHAFDQGGVANGSKQFGSQYEGQTYDDQDWQRECMFDRGFQPGPAQGNKLTAINAPLYLHIKALNEARAKHRSLTRGNFTQRWDSTGQGPYAFSRVFNQEESLVALNTADGNVTLQPAVGKPNGTVFVNTLNPSDTLNVSGGTLNVSLTGKQTKIYVAGTSSPADIGVTRSSMNFTINYKPNDGPLKGATSIQFFARVLGATPITEVTMTAGTGGIFTANYTAPSGSGTIEYWFNSVISGTTVWDSNNSNNYTFSASTGFTMDGEFDSQNFVVSDNGMRIYAAVRGNKLYTATWSTKGGTNDHFIFITDQFGNPLNHPWTKAGRIYGKFDFTAQTKPWIGADPTSAYANGFGVAGRFLLGNQGKAMETEIDLVQVFGSVPKIVYIAVGAYPRANGSNLIGQAPASFGNQANDIEIPEFQALNTASLRDEDLDGRFDVGNPEMIVAVSGNETDGNYGLRRFYLDEVAGDTASLTVKFRPNAGSAAVSDVQVYSNLNRRDKAVLEENPSTVTTSSDTYFLAYAMSGPDASGYYTASLPVELCGAYRLQVRYKVAGVNGGNYIYYTDNALRRDCAIVVSPKKALTLNMYEVNPLIVEAKDATKAGRSTFQDLIEGGVNGINRFGGPDALNQTHYSSMGINMIWLQPIHPIGIEGRDTDPSTGSAFDPGSPYAVRDYWSVAPMLGRSDTDEGALSEFQTFVSSLDDWGVGVMMDGTFNHSSPDAIMGQGAVDLGIPVNAGQQIRAFNPGWYAKEGFPATPAANTSEIAIAPDRNDFGNWTDVREFYFGDYDALVKEKGTPFLNAEGKQQYPDNAYKLAFLLERDEFAGHTTTTRQVWNYFAYYPIYWLEKSGHTASTPKNQSHIGIDGLRCDFAQGLPSQFWEYAINKTRARKWDFIFMAESLDGAREVAGSKRHGVGYRSARHFDVLNENIVFYWRDTFYGYPANGGVGTVKSPKTYDTWKAYDDRRNAFDNVTLLNNLTSHDEVFPHNDVWATAYGYAQVGALDGIPMLMYGQEAGAQNSKTAYGASEANFGPIDPVNMFAKYEANFGKNIPNFKVYNNMASIWNNRTDDELKLQTFYGRVNKARLAAPALQSQNVYFLSKKQVGGGYDDNIFAVGKVLNVGQSAGTPGQSVVFAFVNNNYRVNSNVAASFDVNASASGGSGNYFGIQATRTYNLRDLLSDNPTANVWATNKTGSEILADGIYVGLPNTTAATGSYQAQYLQLVDVSAPSLSFAPPQFMTYGTTNILTSSTTPDSTVTYSLVSGDTAKVTLSGNQLIINSGTGSVVVRATVAATADRSGATADATITFQKASQTITFDPESTTGVVGVSPRTLVASSSSGLAISFSSGNLAVASLIQNSLYFNSPGAAIITASQIGNDNYEAATSVARTYSVIDDGDADGDGQTNADELIAGTDPLNPSSRFQINTILATPTGTTLTWTAVPGRTYTVEAREDLSPSGAWVTIGTVNNANGLAIGSYIDSVTSSSRRFYRLVVQ